MTFEQVKLAPVTPFGLFSGPQKGRFDAGRLKLMFKVAAICSDACLESLPECKDSFVDRLLRQVSRDRFQYHLQFRLVLWLWYLGLLLLKHCSPYMVVMWVLPYATEA